MKVNCWKVAVINKMTNHLPSMTIKNTRNVYIARKEKKMQRFQMKWLKWKKQENRFKRNWGRMLTYRAGRRSPESFEISTDRDGQKSIMERD